MDDTVKKLTADALIHKRDVLLQERGRLRTEQALLARRDREIDRELADCRTAARVFDIDVAFPRDEPERLLYRSLAEARMREAAHAEALLVHTKLPEPNKARIIIGDAKPISPPPSPPPPLLIPQPSISAALWDSLRQQTCWPSSHLPPQPYGTGKCTIKLGKERETQRKTKKFFSAISAPAI